MIVLLLLLTPWLFIMGGTDRGQPAELELGGTIPLTIESEVAALWIQGHQALPVGVEILSSCREAGGVYDLVGHATVPTGTLVLLPTGPLDRAHEHPRECDFTVLLVKERGRLSAQLWRVDTSIWDQPIARWMIVQIPTRRLATTPAAAKYA